MTLAPAWPVVVGAAFAIGVGFGVVVVEINVLFTDAFGDRAAAMLNLLGACFGAGAILGPLALAASGGYRVPFCGGALLAVVAVGLTRDLPATATPPARDPGPPLGLVGGFVALLLLYVGVENGVGGFEATSLRAGGTAAGAAASWTAGYWAAITTGRLLAIPLALRVAAPTLVGGCLLAAAAGLGLAHLPAVAPFAYTLTGLALGPVFPTVLAWLSRDVRGGRSAGAAVADHGPVDVDQGLFLVVGQDRVGADGRLDRGPGGGRALLAVLEQPGLDQQGLGREVEGVGDRLEHPDRRLVQAPLQLAQVRVGDLGHLGQLPQRQVGQLALGPDEGAEGLHLRLPWVVHLGSILALDKLSMC
jgi:hypothetical protein